VSVSILWGVDEFRTHYASHEFEDCLHKSSKHIELAHSRDVHFSSRTCANKGKRNVYANTHFATTGHDSNRATIGPNSKHPT
jgi:hypothetical protein